MRSKTLTILILIAFGLSACGENNENNEDNNTTAENNTTDTTDTTGTTDTNNTNNANNTTDTTDTTFTPPELTEVPETYDFPSKYVEDDSGVRYNGQALRHTIIEGLNSYINTGLEAGALGGAFNGPEDVTAALDAFLESTELGSNGVPYDAFVPLQETYADIGGGKLIDKLAGNDTSTDYKDWNTGLEGWEGQTSATGLVREVFFAQLAAQAFALGDSGEALKDPISGADLPVYVTPEGLDLKQLTQKFLLMSVAFAQAADDYMASGTPEKGLDIANTRSGDAVYSKLEHVWDEGYGYFGGARDYDAYTDEEIAGSGTNRDAFFDTDMDGKIDLKAEFNRGASVNAAKRDIGSADGAKTDFTQDAFDAFVQGRFIIYNAGDTLTAEEKTALEEQRDIAISAWEKAISATAVHYINDTLQVMNTYENDQANYSHATLAKKWGELKGFSLGFQFNEASPMLDPSAEDASVSRFVAFHTLLGNAPALPTPGEADGGADFQAYKADLLAARDILKAAYEFDDANMGDANGENGW